MTRPRSRFGRLALDLLGGLFLTALILAGLEAALWGLDLGSPEENVDKSRGFDPEAAYIVPSLTVDGGWETRFRSRGRQEIQIPAKTEKIRVLTFGGSNTAGFPIGVMNARMQGMQPKHRYEAFNLGRQGYGSARVRLILEQAVEKLEPEVVVIYSGHNEFIEKGFKMDLEGVRLGGWSALASLMVGKTRLYRSIYDYYSASYDSPQKRPKAWESEYNKFTDLTYDQTVIFFGAYEENLRAMCRFAREHGTQVLLCTIVYNRLAVPFSSTFPHSMTSGQVEHFEDLHEEAQAAIPDYLAALLTRSEEERLQNRDWGPSGVGFDIGEAVLESTRPCRAMLKGREYLLETEETWTPKVRQLDRCLKRLFEKDLGNSSRARMEHSEAKLVEALELCPDHPLALFELALVKYLLGRPAREAVELFELAATADRAPRKGSEAINSIIRQVAADMQGVELYDLDRIFRACHPEGLIGYEWMVDYCHLSFGARVIVMEMLSDRIYKEWPPGDFKPGRE